MPGCKHRDVAPDRRCRSCDAWIATELGRCAPAQHQARAGTREDPRAPGDRDDICDVCDYGGVADPAVDDENAPTWGNQLAHARRLSTDDLRRHASVSLNNHHRCEDCFCCAALTVLEQREGGVR